MQLVFLFLVSLLLVKGDLFSDLSDEFDDSSTLSDWTRVIDIEGWPDQMEEFDIDDTNEGKFYLMPKTCGWYRELRAPFFFKTVPSGDFVLEVEVQISSRSGVPSIPGSQYSLAGVFSL